MVSTIFLERHPFAIMINSAIEVFKKETYGLLYGYLEEKRTDDLYLVTFATPYQTAKRNYTQADIRKKEEKRVKETLEKLMSGEQEIGDFHSHPEYGSKKERVWLSQNDKDSLKEKKVSIVIAVNETKKITPWNVYPDRIIGSIKNGNARYNIKIGGYYSRDKSNYRKARIKVSRGLRKILR